jgi:hypothetical protein
MIHDELWKQHNEITAYQPYAKVGIRAFYDGTQVDESHINSPEKVTHAFVSPTKILAEDRPKLPVFLQASQQFLSECMAQFYRHAHWNIFPVRSTARYKTKPAAAIMSLQHARSLSICRMPTEVSRSRGDDQPVDVHLHATDEKWLDNLAKYLAPGNDLRFLKVGLGCPNVKLLEYLNYAVRRDLRPLKRILRACPDLNRLEVNIFGFMQPGRVVDCLDVELVQELKKVVTKVMGARISKTRKRRRSRLAQKDVVTHHRQLFDEIWTFEKKTNGQGG